MNPSTSIDDSVNLGTPAKRAVERLQASRYKVLKRISCDCKDGVLVLYGRVSCFREKRFAQEIVSSVEGAALVVNEIEVD